MNFIRPPKAPNLPLAPSEYERRYTHQINDVLRLYFAQIDNSVGQTISNVSDLFVLEWLDP